MQTLIYRSLITVCIFITVRQHGDSSKIIPWQENMSNAESERLEKTLKDVDDANRVDVSSKSSKTIPWLENMSNDESMQHERTLRDIDDANRVDVSSNRCLTIKTSIEYILKQMVDHIAAHNGLFWGELIPCGSFYERTKVGEPDEFDFALVIRDKKCPFMISKICVTKGVANDDIVIRKGDGNNNITAERLKTTFKVLVDKAMQNVILPKHWQHGGYRRPEFSGYRSNGPALYLQFIYKAPGDEEELFISVDLTLSVAIYVDEPGSELIIDKLTKGDYLLEYLYSEGLLKEVWLLPTLSKVWICSPTVPEKLWMQSFEPDSVPKHVLRLCKIFVKDHTDKVTRTKVNVSDQVTKDADVMYRALWKEEEDLPRVERLVFDLYEVPTFDQLKHFHCGKMRQTELLHGAMPELQENVGQMTYFQSYLFKKIIMTIMAIDQEATSSPLTMTAQVFDIIHDTIIEYERRTDKYGYNDEAVKENGTLVYKGVEYRSPVLTLIKFRRYSVETLHTELSNMMGALMEYGTGNVRRNELFSTQCKLCLGNIDSCYL